MGNLSTTIIAVLLLMGFVVICLSVGWLITGKNRLKRGCGWAPKEKGKDQHCSLCGSKKRCDEDDDKRDL